MCTLIACGPRRFPSAPAGVGKHASFAGCRRASKRTTCGYLVWSGRRTPIGSPQRRTSSSDLARRSRLHTAARPGCCRDCRNGGQVGVAIEPCRSWISGRSAENRPPMHSRVQSHWLCGAEPRAPAAETPAANGVAAKPCGNPPRQAVRLGQQAAVTHPDFKLPLSCKLIIR